MEKQEILKKVNLVKEEIENIIKNENTLIFNSKINEYEHFFEEGMKAKVIGYTFKDSLRFPHDILFTLHLDLTPFEEHNDSLLKNDFFDKDKRPVLTAKEAGYYENEPDLYVSFDATKNNIDGFYNMFTIKDETNDLYKVWKSKNTETPYVSWLEQELEKRLNKIEPHSNYIDELIINNYIVTVNDNVPKDSELEDLIGKEVLINAYEVDIDYPNEDENYVNLLINVTLLDTNEDFEISLAHPIKELDIIPTMDEYFKNTNKIYEKGMSL